MIIFNLINESYKIKIKFDNDDGDIEIKISKKKFINLIELFVDNNF